MKNTFIRLAILITLSIATFSVHAQPADPPADPEAVPIDGGLSILAAAGAALGAKKAWDARKNKKAE